MNFLDILKVASENQGVANSEIKRNGYSTDVGKAKKEKSKPKGVKSAAVQAFLKKKEKEEELKNVEARKKKAELMKLRAEKNTLGKMNNMIKRNHTKEAIFEVEGNDHVTGKNSSGSKETDDTSSFTRLRSETGGKERRAAISNIKRAPINPHFVPKEERETSSLSNSETQHFESRSSSNSEHRKHSKHDHKSRDKKDKSRNEDKHTSRYEDKHKSRDKDGSNEKGKAKPEVKKKKRPPGPPPMSFNDLLKIAEQKKDLPIKQASLKKDKILKKDPGNDRPLTQEEKDRLERKRSKEYQYWLKTGQRHPESDIGLAKMDPKSKQNKKPDPKSVSEKTNNDRDSPLLFKNKSISRQNSNSPSLGKSTNSTMISQNSDRDKAGTSALTSNKILKLPAAKNIVKDTTKREMSSSSSSSSRGSSSQYSAGSSKARTQSSKDGRDSIKSSTKVKTYNETNENVLVCGPSRSNDRDDEPQSTWDRIYSHTKKKRRLPELESDEDEYDEELDDFIEHEDGDDMDDFIDDSEDKNVSSVIKQIFGYDKRRYRDYDDDCDDMETGFAQLEREEKRSARIGLQEDLDDMRLEQEELERKALLKKKNKKFKS